MKYLKISCFFFKDFKQKKGSQTQKEQKGTTNTEGGKRNYKYKKTEKNINPKKRDLRSLTLKN